MLDQFVEIVREAQPDVVILAGDIYDRAVPPPEAVRLYDDVLARVVRGLQVPVIAIAGNHDSAERVDWGHQLLDADESSRRTEVGPTFTWESTDRAADLRTAAGV